MSAPGEGLATDTRLQDATTFPVVIVFQMAIFYPLPRPASPAGPKGETMRTIIMASGALLALAGCAATPTAMMADVQRAEPLYSDRFAGEYQTLSACIALAWSRVEDHNVWGLRQIIDPPNHTAIVQGNYRIFMSAYPMEATLQQVDDATVRIDFRQTPGADDAPEWVWRAVEDCARQRA